TDETPTPRSDGVPTFSCCLTPGTRGRSSVPSCSARSAPSAGGSGGSRRTVRTPYSAPGRRTSGIHIWPRWSCGGYRRTPRPTSGPPAAGARSDPVTDGRSGRKVYSSSIPAIAYCRGTGPSTTPGANVGTRPARRSRVRGLKRESGSVAEPDTATEPLAFHTTPPASVGDGGEEGVVGPAGLELLAHQLLLPTGEGVDLLLLVGQLLQVRGVHLRLP